jgi:6-phosphogluconolactonase (cycloisomerase 2 family)
LITNAAVKDANGAQLTYFEVGANPLQFRYASTGCLYTLDVNSTSQSIFPYVVSSSTGQLTQPTNSAIALSTSNATSVNIGGSYVYVTDAGSTVGGPGSIVPYTQGTSCSLSPVTGGTIANLSTASNPIQTLTDAKNKYVYVLNHSTSNTNYSDSTISAFTIQTTGQLQQLGDTLNPYSVGAGPVCFAEDPTDQYIYTSNQYDGTVTGKILSNITGQLSPLTRGSKFTAVGLPSCLVISSYTGY